MLKKFLALAAATAMLGANAAVYAFTGARAAANGVTGALSSGDAPRPIDGRTILPSIPPLPRVSEPARKAAKPALQRKTSTKKASGKAQKGSKSGASKTAKSRTKAKPTRKARRGR